MTNTKPTLAQEIAKMEKAANQLAQTARVYRIDTPEFYIYRHGFFDGEKLVATEAMKIIKRLQEVIEVQSSALKSVTSMCHSDYEHHTITFNNAQIAHQALIKSKQLLEQ